MSKLENLEPNRVFYYFEKLASIPHGSRNTKAISDYLVSFAKEFDLEHYQDEANNVVIIKEATPGYENAEPVIIQGHMDMVCEKTEDCTIDFEKDGLDLYVDGDFLRAKGTTLGGDDGIAVAYALALLESKEYEHPRLEVGSCGGPEVHQALFRLRRVLDVLREFGVEPPDACLEVPGLENLDVSV